jgi:hypothetical protein
VVGRKRERNWPKHKAGSRDCRPYAALLPGCIYEWRCPGGTVGGRRQYHLHMAAYNRQSGIGRYLEYWSAGLIGYAGRASSIIEVILTKFGTAATLVCKRVDLILISFKTCNFPTWVPLGLEPTSSYLNATILLTLICQHINTNRLADVHLEQ